jgi:apolipoprotein N-acyltransferase
MKEAKAAINFKYRILFLSILSGILLILSFPKFGTGLMGWVALIPLVYAIKDVRQLREGFLLGFISGIIFHIGLLYWIAYAVVQYGNLPYYVGVSAMMLLALYLSVYMAIFASGCIYFRDKHIPLVFAAPVLWTCLEYTKSHLFSGFPWENLGHSQYLCLTLIQISDITGVYGISFMIVMVNIVLSNALSVKPVNKIIWYELILVSSVILISCSYGIFRIDNIGTSMKKADSVNTAIIQGNIDQNIKWNPQFQKETVSIYKRLSLIKGVSGSNLIVWPETATPFFFQDMNGLHQEVVDIGLNSRSWLLFGSPSYKKNGNTLSFSNSAFLISPNGSIQGQYDKVHLVPYGEYVPLRKYFPFFGKLVAGVGDFAKGSGVYPLPMNNHNLGILICYEGIFPAIARCYKNMGTDLLINITNDAWYGTTSAPYQHLSMVIFRAVENRLYVLRAANTGISAFIDPIGKMTQKTELFEEAFLVGKVKYMHDKTFYMLYGDIFVYLCILACLGCILFSLWRIRYDRRNGR